MNDGYLWWLILVGAVITLAVVSVFAIRLPRSEQDVGEDERRAEAAWISATIERFGGVAPTDLVEEVLDLHAEYLATPELARIPKPRPVPPSGPALREPGIHQPTRQPVAQAAPMPPGPPGPQIPPGSPVPPTGPAGYPLSAPLERPGPIPPPRPR